MQTFTEKAHVKELVRKGFFSHISTHSIFLAKETNKLKLAYSIPEGRAKIGAWKFSFLGHHKCTIKGLVISSKFAARYHFLFKLGVLFL